MAFFGKYIEVSPPSRLVWTNDESDDAAVTTVTFEEKDGRTLLVLQELYPAKEALDEASVGMEDAIPEQFEQLDELSITLGERVTIMSPCPIGHASNGGQTREMAQRTAS
jgi:uncharacterized protein YndB with AHSA1/START domain